MSKSQCKPETAVFIKLAKFVGSGMIQHLFHILKCLVCLFEEMRVQEYDERMRLPDMTRFGKKLNRTFTEMRHDG